MHYHICVSLNSTPDPLCALTPRLYSNIASAPLHVAEGMWMSTYNPAIKCGYAKRQQLKEASVPRSP